MCVVVYLKIAQTESGPFGSGSPVWQNLCFNPVLNKTSRTKNMSNIDKWTWNVFDIKNIVSIWCFGHFVI